MIKYKCPRCRLSWNTSHCFDCDKDIPISEKYDDEENSQNYSAFKRASVYKSSNYDIQVGEYFWANSQNRTFRVAGQTGYCNYEDLVEFELCEDNVTVAKGGVGRALVGGALFGGAGAVVGATTRATSNLTRSMYIRITAKKVGMLKIVLVSCEITRGSFIYNVAKDCAEKIITQLEIIAASNKEASANLERQQNSNNSNCDFSVADEILKLKQLLDMGVLTDEEFKQQKEKLLNR